MFIYCTHTVHMFYLLCSYLTLMTSEREVKNYSVTLICGSLIFFHQQQPKQSHHVTDSEGDELDNALPPVDLHQATDCNCFNLPTNPACLVDIHTHRMLEDELVEHVDISAVNGETKPGAGDVNEMEEIQQLTEILDMDD